MQVRRLRQADDDGYRSPLVPGLKSSAEVTRLAQELAFAADRLTKLGQHPPGLYAEVADAAVEIEERTWLAFLTVYLGPLEDTDEPFAAITAVRTSWASGRWPGLEGVATGPRGAHDPERGGRTLSAYRGWAQRAGSQASAFGGEPAWSADRRFARIFERLALPGLHRDARYDLLVTLGQLGVYELRAGSLELSGQDQVTVAAKRALGIGDRLLLERRASALADACDVPLEALDLALYNWERGERATVGMGEGAEPEAPTFARTRAALGV